MSAGGSFYTYMLASRVGGTIYIGVTNDLVRRAFEHRDGQTPGFTNRYGVKRLVYFEEYASIAQAIQREKRLKKWPRDWKVQLIEKHNPDWLDLYSALAGS